MGQLCGILDFPTKGKNMFHKRLGETILAGVSDHRGTVSMPGRVATIIRKKTAGVGESLTIFRNSVRVKSSRSLTQGNETATKEWRQSRHLL